MKYNIIFKNHNFIMYKIYNTEKEEYYCEKCGCHILCYDYGYQFAETQMNYYGILHYYSDLKNELSCNELLIKNIIE